MAGAHEIIFDSMTNGIDIVLTISHDSFQAVNEQVDAQLNLTVLRKAHEPIAMQRTIRVP